MQRWREEEWRVLGVPGHIQQIVMNLVQNALDAVDGGAAPEVRIDLAVQGGRARMTVSDNGPGIPDE